MCLAVPGKIKELGEGGQGIADVLGNDVKLDLSMLPEIEVGDFVLLHAGMAIARIGEAEAMETIVLLEEMGYGN